MFNRCLVVGHDHVCWVVYALRLTTPRLRFSTAGWHRRQLRVQSQDGPPVGQG